jgi:hypothetical protein
MRLYTAFALGATGIWTLASGGCVGSDPEPLFCEETSAASSSSSSSSGAVVECATPKQIRLLEPVTETGVEVVVRYDSLDRRAPRTSDGLPVLSLAVGDLILMDPGNAFKENVTVLDINVEKDNSTGKLYRIFRATFQKTHVLNAPGTEPIEPGCPEFTMPVQNVCFEEGKKFYVGATCWQPTCYYGEYVLIQQPEGWPCAWLGPQGQSGPGTCNIDGICL